MAISNRMKEQSTELNSTKKKVGSFESELNKDKLALAANDQLKADLAAAEKTRDASYVVAT